MPPNQTLIVITSAVFGLLWGSFLGVVKSRLDNIKTAFLGRSHCLNCKKQLKFYDLIPVISFLVLRGRCRYCKKKISIEHIFFELVSALIVASTVYFFGLNWQTVILLLSLSVLIIASFSDIENQEVHVWLLVLGTALALTYRLFLDASLAQLWNITLGALVASIIPFLMYLISRERWMGLGDSIFAIWLGILAGFPAAALGVFSAFLLGGLYGIIVLVIEGRKAQRRIPFGPFLALAAMIALFWGQTLVDSYLKLIGFY